MTDPKQILVTGATGYVGGRLVPRLLEAGYKVRCLVRDPGRLQGRAWLDQLEMVQGDMLQPESLVEAIRDVRVVYYLVHSMAGPSRADIAASPATATREPPPQHRFQYWFGRLIPHFPGLPSETAIPILRPVIT